MEKKMKRTLFMKQLMEVTCINTYAELKQTISDRNKCRNHLTNPRIEKLLIII